MSPSEEHSVDWRDAAAYAPLLQADRSIFAWEWLRRDPTYRATARQSLASADGATVGRRPVGAARWGLHAFEPPELAAPRARPVWLTDVHPLVLRAMADGPAEPVDAFDMAHFGSLATLIQSRGGGEHLLLSDGLRTIRIDIVAGSVSHGPVQLRYLLAGLSSAAKPLLTLRRLLALNETGRFARSLHACEKRARRWVLALRAHDGLAAGADQREIAAVLLGAEAREPRWRSERPSLRSQVQRLVGRARRLAAGEYLALLH